MAEPSSEPPARTAAELRAELELERAGAPFLVYRDGEGAQRLLALPPDSACIWVGRRPGADVCLEWDEEVSSVHAQFERGGDEWTVVDDGLSSNGSYVNGERITARRRLRDGDVLRVGRTTIVYRAPADESVSATRLSEEVVAIATLTQTQRNILIALCRPFRDAASFASPASNQEIADELFLSVDAVKGHLRVLFDKFGIADLPQNRKRLALVERALQSGVVSERDL